MPSAATQVEEGAHGGVREREGAVRAVVRVRLRTAHKHLAEMALYSRLGVKPIFQVLATLRGSFIVHNKPRGSNFRVLFPITYFSLWSFLCSFPCISRRWGTSRRGWWLASLHYYG